MNQYGDMAMKHWRDWLPERFEQIDNPQEFFSTLGQQLAEQIQELADHLAGPDLPGESYLDKAGRLNVARKQAEEKILHEYAFLDPEAGDEDDETEMDDTPAGRAVRFSVEIAPMIEAMSQEVDEARAARWDRARQAHASDPTD